MGGGDSSGGVELIKENWHDPMGVDGVGKGLDDFADGGRAGTLSSYVMITDCLDAAVILASDDRVDS